MILGGRIVGGEEPKPEEGSKVRAGQFGLVSGDELEELIEGDMLGFGVR